MKVIPTAADIALRSRSIRVASSGWTVIGGHIAEPLAWQRCLYFRIFGRPRGKSKQTKLPSDPTFTLLFACGLHSNHAHYQNTTQIPFLDKSVIISSARGSLGLFHHVGNTTIARFFVRQGNLPSSFFKTPLPWHPLPPAHEERDLLGCTAG